MHPGLSSSTSPVASAYGSTGVAAASTDLATGLDAFRNKRKPTF